LGDNTDLNREDISEEFTEEEYLAQESLSTGRYIFTADTLPVYYPSGPEENVSLSDLDGWTLCWSNLYGDEDYAVDALDGIWAACDGAYLMLAGGGIGDGDLAGSGPGAEELANTGADSGWILGAAIALMGAGTLVAIRRQRA
jgi:LPXTG-motif cell wall-anchored protein